MDHVTTDQVRITCSIHFFYAKINTICKQMAKTLNHGMINQTPIITQLFVRKQGEEEVIMTMSPILETCTKLDHKKTTSDWPGTGDRV